MKQLFEDIKGLFADSSYFKHVDLDIEQLLDEGANLAFQRPAVFIDLFPEDFETVLTGNNVTQKNKTLTLRFTFEQYTNDLDWYLEVQKINRKLINFTSTDNEETYSASGFTPLLEGREPDVTNVFVYSVTYQYIYYDLVSEKNYGKLKKVIPNLEITKDLEIDSEVLRTGKLDG